MKFVEREIRRGNAYDGIIMDPPSYGKGPKGELWKIEDSIYPLIERTALLLSDKPLFFLLSSYTTGLQSCVMTYMLSKAVTSKIPGRIISDEVGLTVKNDGLILPCGCSSRIEF